MVLEPPEGLEADESHRRACKAAPVRKPATQRSYRTEYARQHGGAARVPGRSADDLKKFWSYRDLVKQFVEPYLTGRLTIGEVADALYDLKYPPELETAPAPPNPLCCHCGKPNCTVKHTSAPQGYMDSTVIGNKVVQQWVPPGSPPPIYVEHKLTDSEKRNPSDELAQQSRNAARHWNLANGGEGGHVAIPFVRPSFDDPHGLAERGVNPNTGRSIEQETHARWAAEAVAEREAAQQQRLAEMREEDRQRRIAADPYRYKGLVHP